ncbi:MAG: GNAT family N-acetyltransferase [Candidatus Aegiribacteria sp.]|nr:GNAT family N-acetyltransferase [Candidatus Aegiribacteria sp.]
METISFEVYTKLKAAAVARMWSESREGWPPGFLGASEFTADSIEMEENSSGKLYTVLAMEGSRVVGYCRTTPYGGEPDAAYVALLNVVPDLHGKKLGKKLLLDAVRRTAEDGYYRIDLHTWPANLKAMPLYKKTGFFWVPDSMVYMQNYMPFLLGRTEFRDFLGDTDWYDCFARKLEVEPDEQRTESGREIFSYLFKIGDDSFRAEFDRRGRVLSSLKTPTISASFKRNSGKIFYGKAVRVSIEGSSLPQELQIESHEYLSAPEVLSRNEASGGFDIIPEPVEVPIPDRDRSPRVTAVLPGCNPLSIGIGIRAEEPVSILSSPVRRLSRGQKELSLDIRKLTESDSLRLEASLDGEVFLNETYTLEENIFQQIRIPLPELTDGSNELVLTLFLNGKAGAEEKIILVSGPYSGKPQAFLTRKMAVIVGKDSTLGISRTGVWGTIWIPGEDDSEKMAGSIRISAGPPYWNSDLLHQVYDFELGDGCVKAETNWPSRPGLKYVIRYRIDVAGFMMVESSVINESSSRQKVSFIANWRGGVPFATGKRIIPLKKGLFVSPEVYNQIPDVSEDYPKNTEELAAPWLAVSSENMTLMAWFPGWQKLQYGRPETEKLIAASGERAVSPPFRVLLSKGDLKDLLSEARILGWDTGSVLEKIGFIDHNIEPVIGEGYELKLSHNLLGKRSGAISVNGKLIAEGSISSGSSISAAVPGEGDAEISLDIAGRQSVFPVRIIGGSTSSVELSEKDGILTISGGRLKALIDPSEFGHVYSLLLDGVEYLMSSHPGPSDFAWEKPWFGGIHPRINDRNKPFRLDSVDCSWREFQTPAGGLQEKGWEMHWAVDHKKYGSLDLTWKVSMLPDVPLLKTSFCPQAVHDVYPGAEFDIRGFLTPGGEHDKVILTAQSNPPLRQGRKHAGAWLDAGSWGRVETPGRGFVEVHSISEDILFAEDYADSGCHFAIFNMLDRKKEIEVLWIFGNCKDDEALSRIYRALKPDLSH